MNPHDQNIPFLDLVQQHRSLKPELMAAFEQAIDTAAFVGGAQLSSFEEEFASYCNVACCAGVSNGTDAIRLALQAMDLKRNFLAITVPNTFIATTEAVTMSGGRFAFVDIDRKTSLMDMNRLEDELRKRFSSSRPEDRPDVVIPVHLYGQCVDMTALTSIAARYNILVLEDAAQAQGASWADRRAGSLGHAAAFSFYAGKNLGGLGEAGAITSDDGGLIERVKMLREHGQKKKYIHELEGSNGRLDAIQAAFLRIKLQRLETWNERRRLISDAYDKAFSESGWVRPVCIHPQAVPSRHLYVIHVDRRDQLADWLRNRGINTGLHYPLPLHLQECYAHFGLGTGSYPLAEEAAKQLLSLPLFPEMTPEQVQRVIEGVLSFGGQA